MVDKMKGKNGENIVLAYEKAFSRQENLLNCSA